MWFCKAECSNQLTALQSKCLKYSSRSHSYIIFTLHPSLKDRINPSLFLLFIYLFIYLSIYYFCLRWVFVAARGLSPVAVSRGYSLLRCSGFSLQCFSCRRERALGARASVVVACGFQSTGSVAVAHGLSCSAVCGIFLEQGSNPCPLHWQAGS